MGSAKASTVAPKGVIFRNKCSKSYFWTFEDTFGNKPIDFQYKVNEMIIEELPFPGLGELDLSGINLK